MKKYLIEWGTDYCDDFPERNDEEIIEAETETEAIEKFESLKIPKAIIYKVKELNE